MHCPGFMHTLKPHNSRGRVISKLMTSVIRLCASKQKSEMACARDSSRHPQCTDPRATIGCGSTWQPEGGQQGPQGIIEAPPREVLAVNVCIHRSDLQRKIISITILHCYQAHLICQCGTTMHPVRCEAHQCMLMRGDQSTCPAANQSRAEWHTSWVSQCFGMGHCCQAVDYTEHI